MEQYGNGLQSVKIWKQVFVFLQYNTALLKTKDLKENIGQWRRKHELFEANHNYFNVNTVKMGGTWDSDNN